MDKATIETLMDEPLFSAACVGNPRFQVVVWLYLFGQVRIQLLDREQAEPMTPACAIVRELYTYSHERMFEEVKRLIAHEDPLSYCSSLERPWNCDEPGQRIRLDNRLEDRPEMVGRFNDDGTPR